MKRYIKDFKSFTINEQSAYRSDYDSSRVDKEEGIEYGKQYEVHDKNTGSLLGWFQVDDGGLFNDGSEQDDFPIFTPNKEAYDEGLVSIEGGIHGAKGYETFSFPENGVIVKDSEVGELALNTDTGFYEAPNIQMPVDTKDEPKQWYAETEDEGDEIVSTDDLDGLPNKPF